VFPKSLSASFVDTRLYPVLSTSYNDGTIEQSLIQDGVNAPRWLRTYAQAQRLTAAQLATLRNFWETTVQGGLYPFYFYDPWDVLPGQEIGSNFDPTGDNTQGRVTCFFRGDWSQQGQLSRHVVPSLLLVEVA
jgi:hypothetical protein